MQATLDWTTIVEDQRIGAKGDYLPRRNLVFEKFWTDSIVPEDYWTIVSNTKDWRVLDLGTKDQNCFIAVLRAIFVVWWHYQADYKGEWEFDV